MFLTKALLIAGGVIIGLVLLYRLFFSKDKFADEYHSLYNKILSSEEYKVKGQYNK